MPTVSTLITCRDKLVWVGNIMSYVHAERWAGEREGNAGAGLEGGRRAAMVHTEDPGGWDGATGECRLCLRAGERRLRRNKAKGDICCHPDTVQAHAAYSMNFYFQPIDSVLFTTNRQECPRNCMEIDFSP